MPLAITISIAGTDRTDYLKAHSGRINRDINGRAQFSGILETQARSFSCALGSSIVIAEGASKRFAGNIGRIVKSVYPRNDSLQIAIEARDYSAILDHRLVSFETVGGESLYQIVQILKNQVLTGENITIANVVNPGPTIADPIKVSYESVSSVLNRLVQILNATASPGYLWLIDFNRDLHLEQFSPGAAPFAITDSSANWFDLKCVYSDEDYRNVQYERTQGGLTRTVTETIDLDLFAPVTRAAILQVFYIKINGNPKSFILLDSTVPGFLNPTSGVDFWVNKNDYGLFPVDYIIGAGDTLEINYKGVYSSNVVPAYAFAEIAARATLEGGSGYWEAIEDQKNIGDPGQLGQLALGRLAKFGKTVALPEFKTYTSGLEPGQRIAIQNTPIGINDSYLIYSVNYEWRASGGEQDDFLHSVFASSNEPLPGPEEYVAKLVEMARIGPPEGEAGGDESQGEEEYCIWHVRDALTTGKNGTNHHELKRDCLAFDVWASTVDGPPTGTLKANLVYTDPDTTTANILFGDGVVINTAGLRSVAITFPSPAVVMKEHGFVELNVTDPGGASNVMFTMRAR